MDPGWGGACSRGAETARERAGGLGPCWGVGREAHSSQPSLRSLARRACAAGMRGRGQCAAGGPVYSIPIRIVRQPPA